MGVASLDKIRPNHKYFRGALIRWAWHHWTKSDQIDGSSVQLLSQLRLEREDRKYLWEKKLVPELGIEPLPFGCEASALTIDPS